jgi:hypothetical protein
MAYFPEKLMPLTPKSDAPSSSSDVIAANDYNTHDQEIRSIEEYLGFPQPQPPTAKGRTLSDVPVSIFDRVSALTEKMNNLLAHGLSSTSGVALSGPASTSISGILNGTEAQKMVAPRTVPVSFLTSSVGSLDNTINVISTDNFPRSGIVTLISPANSGKLGTLVEYVTYGSKDGTSLLECRRGVNGTFALNIVVDEKSPPQKNSQDDCFTPISAGSNICGNRWPAFNKDVLTVLSLGATGTKDELVFDFMLHPSKYPLEPDSDTMSTLRDLAGQVGILATIGGKYVLQSADPFAKSTRTLTGNEASQFVEGIVGAGIFVSTPYADIIVGSDPNPVFLGQLSIQYAPVYWRRTNTVHSEFKIIQDQFRCGMIGNVSSVSDISYGGTSYHMFCVPFPVDDSEVQ